MSEKQAMSRKWLSEKEMGEEVTPSTVHTHKLGNVTPEETGLVQNDYLTEEDKMRLVCSRFIDITEDDLMEGDEFFTELDSGKFDKV